MIQNKNRLKIPQEYLHHIDPNVRVEVFKEIIKGYTERYNFKCLYAYMNTDPTFLLDYGLVFKGRNDDNTNDIILYDMVPINASRCTPHFLYYKDSGNLDKFFQFGAEEMVIISPNKFYEFLATRCLLTRDKTDKMYWKKQEHAREMTGELLDLSLGYVRKKPIDIEA